MLEITTELLHLWSNYGKDQTSCALLRCGLNPDKFTQLSIPDWLWLKTNTVQTSSCPSTDLFLRWQYCGFLQNAYFLL